MHEGKMLTEFLRINKIPHKELAEAINVKPLYIQNRLRNNVIPAEFKAKLAAIGITFTKGGISSTYKPKHTIYTVGWFKEQMRKLRGLGVIEADWEVAEAIECSPTKVSQAQTGSQPPSKGMVQKFLEVYGKYLAEQTEIIVRLEGNRSAKLLLPEDYTAKDIERVIRALNAHK